MTYKLIYLARRNPSVRAEHWPRVWRSHAVFASQFPSLGVQIRSLLYCSRVLSPEVDGTPVDPLGMSRDYDGAALVSSPSPTWVEGEISPDHRARINDDELRIFSTHTPNFSFHCKEALVHGGPPGEAAVIRFLVRKSGETSEGFAQNWSERHATIATRAADATGVVNRYVHNAVMLPPPPDYPFDGIAETWFATPQAAARSLVSDEFRPVSEDLATFCDLQRSVTLLTYVTHRWPRA